MVVNLNWNDADEIWEQMRDAFGVLFWCVLRGLIVVGFLKWCLCDCVFVVVDCFVALRCSVLTCNSSSLKIS